MPLINDMPQMATTADEVAAANETTRMLRNITISDQEPTAENGSDGDIWLVYEE